MRRTSSPLRILARLLRAPTFTSASIVTLALGIGANVAIFSVAYNVLLKPLPYEEPERLVGVWNAAPGLGFPEVTQSAALYYTFKDHADSLESVAMWTGGRASVTGTGRPEELRSATVTHELLPTLGVDVAAGRWFAAADDAPGAADTVVLAHGEAEGRFGSAAQALGETMLIGGVTREVIGVLPRGFRILDRQADLYLPMQLDRAQVSMGQFNYQCIGRLRPGVDHERASAELTALLETASESFPRGLSLGMLQEAQFRSFVRPLIVDAVGNIQSVIWILMGTVGLLLLIALANVANLFIVRAEGRSREIALRTAIGASRWDLFRQFLQESLTLSVAGGIFGLAFAWAALRALVALAPSSLPRLHEIGINAPVVGFAAVIALATGLVFGCLPTLRMGTKQLFGALKEGGRSSTAGRGRHLVRHGLVVTQIGLALVLLIGSGLMFRTFSGLLDADPGYDVEANVLTFGASVPRALISDNAEVSRLQQRYLDELARLPGVESVGAVTNVPLSNSGSSDGLWVEGFFPPEGQLPPIRRWKFASDGYLETMGRPLVAGRVFNRQDLEERRSVVMVSENLALEYWSSAQEAVGKRVLHDPSSTEWREIVGVVSDIYDDGIDQEKASVVYFPFHQKDLWGEEDFVQRSLIYVLRVTEGTDPSSLIPAAERTMWSLNPDIPLTRAQSMREVYQRSFARTSFALTMLGLAASVALLLGLIGVYATLSYIISQRVQEFGVRIALGAQLGQVRSMVVKQGMLLALFGILLGVGGALAATRVLAQMIYGVSTTDTATFAAVTAALLLTVTVASLAAARRATSVSPLEALRND